MPEAKHSLTEIEFRQQHRLEPAVKARLEALDDFRIQLAYNGISTWTTYEAGEEWDVPTVRFYSARRHPFAEWCPTSGKATSLGQAVPFTFTAKNIKVLTGKIRQMARYRNNASSGKEGSPAQRRRKQRS